MKIYISLPKEGREKEAREKADRVKTMLSKMGHQPVSPFEIYSGKNPTYGQYLGHDIAVLIDCCDAIFLCEGWHGSKGCQVEHKVAEVFGKKIIFEHREEPTCYYR